MKLVYDQVDSCLSITSDDIQTKIAHYRSEGSSAPQLGSNSFISQCSLSTNVLEVLHLRFRDAFSVRRKEKLV